MRSVISYSPFGVAGVHIFGLLCAISLTLAILPVIYYIFSAKLRWIRSETPTVVKHETTPAMTTTTTTSMAATPSAT